MPYFLKQTWWKVAAQVRDQGGSIAGILGWWIRLLPVHCVKSIMVCSQPFLAWDFVDGFCGYKRLNS